MTDKRRVDFFRHDLGEDELQSIRATFESVFVAQGPRVAELEKRLGEYLGAEHVIGVSSCSVGLILALKALGVAPGDEVITTPLTYVATSNAALHLGASPIFVDVDPQTGLLDPDATEAAITPRTRAIVPVHLYGQMVDMKRFRAIADRHKVGLLEDAAHAVEATRDGIRPGALGDIAAFSFYATKGMTSGDGGALTTNDAAIAAQLRRLRNFGISKDAHSRHGKTYQHWDMVELGYKAPLTDIDAAILMPQIAKLDERRSRRTRLVERYEEMLRDVPGVDLIHWTEGSSHLLFTVLVDADRRDRILTSLGERGIGCAVNYRAVHTLSYYRDNLPQRQGALRHAEDIGNRTVTLPLWPGLPATDVEVVVDVLRQVLTEVQ